MASQSEGLEGEPSTCKPEAVRTLVECLLHGNNGVSDEADTGAPAMDSEVGPSPRIGSEPHLQCIEALQRSADRDPQRCTVPIMTAVQALLRSPACDADRAASCGAVINALTLIGSSSADRAVRRYTCEALGAWLGQDGVARSMPQQAATAMIGESQPCGSLMESVDMLLTINNRHDQAKLPAPIVEQLMLVAGAMAHRGRQIQLAEEDTEAPESTTSIDMSYEELETERRRQRSAAARLSRHVLTSLHMAVAASATWETVHMAAEEEATEHWHRQLSPHEHERHVGHHAGLHQEGLRWAIDHGEWALHETRAREAIKQQVSAASLEASLAAVSSFAMGP